MINSTTANASATARRSERRNRCARVVRDMANEIIEQRERQAKGWDTGLYRDDDIYRGQTIETRMGQCADTAFAVSIQFARYTAANK